MKLLLTGATGFIGTELVRRLPASVTSIPVLSRDPGKAETRLRDPRVKGYRWNAEAEVAPATALEGVDAVIHLAGENVGVGRWTEETKRRILASRELGTRNLVAGLNRLARPPIFISASAIGYYGDSGDRILGESDPRGAGFLAQVCEVWEAEARKAIVPRLIIPRLGVVFGPSGGALAKLIPLFKTGLGGPVGGGKQWVGWIHRDDVVGFLIQALTDSKIEGIYNLVAPAAIRNSELAETLGHVLHRPAVLPVPAIALKLALGEMAEETILASQRVSDAKLTESGFRYAYPTLEGALRQIIAP